MAYLTRLFAGKTALLDPLVGTYGYYLKHAWWMWLILIFIMQYEGLYTSRRLFWEEARDIIKYTFFWIFLVIMVLALTREIDSYSRAIIFFIWFYALLLFPFFHYLNKKLFIKMGIFRTNTLIVGAGNAGISTLTGILKQPYLGYKVVGFCDDDEEKLKKGIELFGTNYPVLGKVEDVYQVIADHNIENVIIAIPSLHATKLAEIANKVHKIVRRLIIVPNVKGVSLTNSEVNYLFDEQLFLLKISNNLASLTNRGLKRAFDIILSVVLLPFILLLILVLGILIKLDSKGPVFFVHKRTGKDGKTIPVIKFRTMFKDAHERLISLLNSDESLKKEWEENYKLQNDPRITKVGDFLRRTSLDELPQIFNVLKGDMSLVGPRPVLKEELKNHYGRYAEYYYMVKPGITGLWQVGGRSNTTYEYRVWIDTWYILNWSLWMDITILFKTAKVVLKSEGAV